MTQIKSISTYLKEANQEAILTETEEYSQLGNLVINKKYDSNKTVIDKSCFEYNKDGQKIAEKQYTSEVDLAEEHYFRYNTKGQLIEINRNYTEGYSATLKIEIDDNTKTRIETELDEDGNIEEKQVWKYSNNLLTEHCEYDENDKMVRKTEYIYDQSNRLIEEHEFEKKFKKPEQSKLYTYYDDSTNISQLIIKNRKGKIINQYLLEYDDQDRVIKQTSPQSGTLLIKNITDKERLEQTYDVSGNLLSETKIFQNEYGHKIKEETPLLVTEYKIEYWEK